MDLDRVLSQIKPFGSDENGKYNKKLYGLLKKIRNNKYENSNIRIWFNMVSRWDGTVIDFHKNIHKKISIPSQIMIDPSGQMISGYFLPECLKKGSPTRFSLCAFHPNQMIDVTDWFFDTYSRIGHCMFDNNHHDFENHYNQRYYIINKNSRKCRFCGEHFKRHIKKYVEVKKYEVWKPQKEESR
ncbi:hypothetical protein [Paenibacillus xylaniclasticus]|uniref:hypothetical protein n=1 Tax=Paenibacillus xylaniclasticus TaxID=588083 RepID=UPI000FD8F6BB|nr:MULTISPECIES: hypothetical protein [Paenibacillus]GFN32447.1 hypothetical protein PCURB6_27070 [Paenibacillus curdlanolyticus]